MERWREWLEDKMRSGEVCAAYTRKIVAGMCKMDCFDICLDVNGIDFMCIMSARGEGLPYDAIRDDFSRYINGQYVATYRNDANGLSYTSSMYIGKRGETIEVSETCVMLLDCKDCVMRIPEYSVCCIYVDSESRIEVECPLTSKAYVEVFGNGKAYSMTERNVELIKR